MLKRLDGLADGIFAIVMTLLVIEIRVPELHGSITNETLWEALTALTPLLVSYILSFAVLVLYWMGHNYITTEFAKTKTRQLAYLNMPFFAAVALIPFSAHLLGTYPETQVAVAVYGTNVVIIGVLLSLILKYVLAADAIEKSLRFTPQDVRIAYIRVLMPAAVALIAMAISAWSPVVSIYLFILAILANLIPGTVTKIDTLLTPFFR